MERRGCCSRGYTLVELLIAIAILSILAALLLPVFAASSEQARQAVCASNLRQIETAFQEYADDNDGAHCSLRQPTLRYSPDSLIWAGMLFPYLADIGVYRCPSSDYLLVPTSGGLTFDGLSDTPVNDAQLSIGMNAGFDPAGRVRLFRRTGRLGPRGRPDGSGLHPCADGPPFPAPGPVRRLRRQRAERPAPGCALSQQLHGPGAGQSRLPDRPGPDSRRHEWRPVPTDTATPRISRSWTGMLACSRHGDSSRTPIMATSCRTAAARTTTRRTFIGTHRRRTRKSPHPARN